MNNKKTLMIMSIAAALALVACGPSDPQSSSSSSQPSMSESSSSDSSSEIDNGDGSKENPFKLNNKEDLIALQSEVNDEGFNGYVADLRQAPYFEFTSDIDLGGMEWTPIGGYLNKQATNLFSANIIGNGHTISNFKITETDPMVSSYGLFGNFHGEIKGLNVANFNINLEPSTIYTNTFVGGLVGLGDIASFNNVSVDGSIRVRYNKQNADFYIGGLVGYNITYATEYDGKVMGNVTNTLYVDTNVKIDSNVATTVAGGIAGWAGTNSGEGVLNMAYLTSKGRLTTPHITGGIAGYLDKYATISYAQVLGNVEGGENVGGIVAIAASDSAIQNSYVASKQIMASSLTAAYEFEGGLIAGLYTPINEPAAGSKSTLMRNVYAADTTVLAVAGEPKEDPHKVSKATITNLIDKNFLSKNLEFGEAEWIYSDEAYPVLNKKNALDLSLKVEVTFVSNMSGVSKDKTTAAKYTFNTFDTLVSKKGYTFKGWFYDEELTQDYRFYLPLYNNKTLYGDWANYSEFAGMYVATKYNAGILDFDDNGGLNFYYGDYTYLKGNYEYYGNYIKFGSVDSFDWYNTYGEWNKETGELKFTASDNAATEFTYVRANELIGFYRNGKVSIDFVTDNAGTITIPSGYDVVEIPFTYKLKSNGVEASSKDGKLTSITKLSDGSIEFEYDGKTYSANTKLPFMSADKTGPYVGKTYYGSELNENFGVKDITFNKDGTATFRHSYQRTSASHSYLDIDPDLVDIEKEIYGATKTREGQNDSEFYLDVYGIQKNEGFKSYSYVELIYYIKNGETADMESKVLSTNMTKTVNADGIMVFQGTGDKKASTLHIFEVAVDLDGSYMHVNQFASYNHTGGYYADGNDLIIKGDGSDQAMQTVLKYNAEEDYFITESHVNHNDPTNPENSKTEQKFFMLAPYQVHGVFNIEGVSGLDGEVYAYLGHTYYLAKDGSVSVVSVTSGTFKNFDTVSLNINGAQYTFNVVNLYGINTLKLSN